MPSSAPRRPAASGFSLIELLVVIAILAMMVGLSAVAVQGFRAPAVQQAADQVMSGLSLARQIAITKNTKAALLIAHQTNGGFPSEPFRHWTVVYLNKGEGTSAPGAAGGWTLVKDWEPLPNGAVFSELLDVNYKSLPLNPLQIQVGEAVSPAHFITTTNTFTVYATPKSAAALIPSTGIPSIIFKSDGASSSGRAVRISQGTVMSGNASITSTNQYYFVETDTTIGRIRMRSPESYQANP
jgi:prepilin-type N-terminal cleavage/methylation domain-containing protein